MLSRERQLAVAALAGRAPSPHNIQPARWRYDDSTVELWEDPTRWLAVGDASGRDNRIALGMAWEGMTIALSGEGLALELAEQETLHYPTAETRPRLVARGHVTRGATLDPLLSSLTARTSYRGRFAPANAAQLEILDARIQAFHGVVAPLPPAATSQIAAWYDAAAAEGLNEPAFAAELYRWMRFSRRDSRWSRDGLSADCLALSPLAAWGASILLRPSIVRLLAAISATRLLVSEASKIKSAARLVLIHRPSQTDVFELGRTWYRFWLALDQAGIAGVPMSSLADAPAYAKQLVAAWPLPAGSVLVNLMRLGPAPQPAAPRSARLPVEEILRTP